MKRMIEESEVLKESDDQWPDKDVGGTQELEVRLGNKAHFICGELKLP